MSEIPASKFVRGKKERKKHLEFTEVATKALGGHGPKSALPHSDSREKT
jgi:hypothetical protein